MSERSLMSWANLDASIKFPTDLLDSNSRYPTKLRDVCEDSEGLGLRANDEDSCAPRLFGLENTVNFCDVIGRQPAVTPGGHFKSESRETETSNWSTSTVLEKKGLRRMAGLLVRTILNRRFCSHQEVAAEVERLLPAHAKPQAAKEEKNIRRRVYDALNVMIAAGVLEREQEGAYRSPTTCLHFHDSPLSARRNQMQAELTHQASRLARKRELQAKTHAQLEAIRRCLYRNRTRHSCPSKRLPFPLVVLLQTGISPVNVQFEEEQLAMTHPCLPIYSETDLLEEAWVEEGEGEGGKEAKEEWTGCKLQQEEEFITT